MSLTNDLDDHAEYAAALATGRMLVRHCEACDRSHHYPRSYCPLCGSSKTKWREGSGLGTIYSFTVWRRRAGVTVPAYVTIAEGPTLLASIVTDNPDKIAIGASVALLPAAEGEMVPQFRLAGDAA